MGCWTNSGKFSLPSNAHQGGRSLWRNAASWLANLLFVGIQARWLAAFFCATARWTVGSLSRWRFDLLDGWRVGLSAYRLDLLLGLVACARVVRLACLTLGWTVRRMVLLGLLSPCLLSSNGWSSPGSRPVGLLDCCLPQDALSGPPFNGCRWHRQVALESPLLVCRPRERQGEIATAAALLSVCRLSFSFFLRGRAFAPPVVLLQAFVLLKLVSGVEPRAFATPVRPSASTHPESTSRRALDHHGLHTCQRHVDLDHYGLGHHEFRDERHGQFVQIPGNTFSSDTRSQMRNCHWFRSAHPPNEVIDRKGNQAVPRGVSKRGITRSTMNMPLLATALCVTCTHFWGEWLVVHIRNLAVRGERGLEGYMIHAFVSLTSFKCVSFT